MGYFGLKTSGHSGTQFKHKRAFIQSNKFLNNQHTFENVHIKGAEKKDHFTGPPTFRILILITFCTIIYIIITIFIHKINIVMAEKKEANSIEYNWYLDNIQSSDEKFKASLFERAKSEYKSGNYLRAHEKLYAILLIDENNVAAVKMLIKVLEAKCSNLDIGCKQLSKYSKYLEKKYESNHRRQNLIVCTENN